MTIAQAGVRFDFLIPGNGNVDLTTDVANLHAMAKAQPGSILAIEAPNEINGWPITYDGITDYRAAGAAVQKDLWAAVKADPLLTGSAVYALTLSDGLPSITDDETALGDLAAYVTDGNAHIYGAQGYNVWAYDVPYWLPVQSTPTPGVPMVISETGYQTIPDSPGTDDVSENVAAKYVLNLLLHNSLKGIAATYIYDLADAPSGDPQRYGLFNPDWTPKAAATALHNLTTILRGAGSGPLPGVLNYSLPGLPSSGYSLLLGGDTAFSLAVWNEVTIWDSTSNPGSRRHPSTCGHDRPRRHLFQCVRLRPDRGHHPGRDVRPFEQRAGYADRPPRHRGGRALKRKWPHFRRRLSYRK